MSGHEDIARADRIMELCRSAHAKGWVFSSLNIDGRCTGLAPQASEKKACGCVLQACADELGLAHWCHAAEPLGIVDDVEFGRAFDRAIDGNPLISEDRDALLGTLIAMRLKKEGLVA